MLKAWVKYVNNLLTTTSKTSGSKYTVDQKTEQQSTLAWVQSQLLPNQVNFVFTNQSTANLMINNLLNKSFALYPQSLLIRLLKKN